jgi:hypothetical protein
MLGYVGLCSDHRTCKNIHVQIDIISSQKFTMDCYEYKQLKQAPEHQHQISSLFSFLHTLHTKHFKMKQGVLRCY